MQRFITLKLEDTERVSKGIEGENQFRHCLSTGPATPAAGQILSKATTKTHTEMLLLPLL